MVTKGEPVADNLYSSLLGADAHNAPLEDRAAALEFEALLHRGRDVYRQCPAKRLAFHTALRDLIAAWESLLREALLREARPTTPEDTLREAGISSKRQAKYQRRMSSLLARRS